MVPMCFDFGFGPFRWVCTSGKPEDLQKTDEIACQVLEEMMKDSPKEIQQQMKDNITWIKGAQENKLVVGSQERILYEDAEGLMKIANTFNLYNEKIEFCHDVLRWYNNVVFEY